ncbi:MAG: deoxyuridine 5'-triphosphate nucleotidohydrolase [Clostridiales bacterium]|nr:MAG: deoxyuridine 5'-triphosphate nucleotidohydrolase [Clostridiales bacterium]
MQQISKFYKVSAERFSLDGGDSYENISLPERATKGSAGYDFITPSQLTLAPGESCVIATGIRAEIDEGWVLQIFPKSGLGFKFGVRLANTVGIIDSDYFYSDNEGHILVKIINGASPLTLPAKKAFCQGVFTPFGITYDDNATSSRNGGFGSTEK